MVAKTSPTGAYGSRNYLFAKINSKGISLQQTNTL
jgi:hypothetical protein